MNNNIGKLLKKDKIAKLSFGEMGCLRYRPFQTALPISSVIKLGFRQMSVKLNFSDILDTSLGKTHMWSDH